MIIGLICVDSQQNRALESVRREDEVENEDEDVAATTGGNRRSEGGLWVLGIWFGD